MAAQEDTNYLADVSGVGPVPAAKAPNSNEPPKVTDDESFKALRPGTKFVDPEGKTRWKPIEGDADFQQLPEGAEFMDPEGKLRTKPKYEGVNFTAQVTHDMALTPKGKRKALELQYPGKVKTDENGELYVDDGGVLRKPGRGGMGTGLAHAAAEAAPMGGMFAGGAFGGALATPETLGTGTAAGAFGGGVLGGMAGQAFNNIILRLSGIDEAPSEEIKAIGNAGLASAVGDVGGRAIASVPAGVAAAKGAVNRSGELLGKFLGVNKDAIGDVTRIAEHGEHPATGLLAGLRNKLGLTETSTPVRPSAIFMESPNIHLSVETFDPAFRTQNVLQKGATKFYEEKVGDLYEQMGLKKPPSFTKPRAAVETQKAGETLVQGALEKSAQADAETQAILAKRKAELEAGLPQKLAQRDQLMQSHQKSLDAANGLIEHALQDISKDADGALKMLNARSNSGDFWWLVGEKLKTAHDAVTSAYRRYAGNAYQVAGKQPLSTQPLTGMAQQYLRTVPEEFQKRMSTVLNTIQELAANEEAEGGSQGVNTFAELHGLRTMLRASADWYDLPSDLKNSTFKTFSKAVDNILQDSAHPENVQLAARMLNATDEWYANEIKVFNNAEVSTIIKGLKGGEPADPAKLYKVLVKPHSTDLINRLHTTVGDTIWAGVKAAQKDHWLRLAGTADPLKPDAVKFADQVVDAYHNGNLAAVQGEKEGAELFRLAQMIHALKGKIDININPSDTAFDIMRHAYVAGEMKAKLGKEDPLKVLNEEVSKLEDAVKKEAAGKRAQDPLHFLFNKSTGANAAVEKILGDEDLVLATEALFTRNSPQFKALQQVWMDQLFVSTVRPGEKLFSVSPEVQKLMFGTDLPVAKKLMEQVVLMRGQRDLAKNTAKGMAAVSKITHPMGTFNDSSLLKSALREGGRIIPGRDVGARAILEQYYELWQKVATSPGLLRMLEKAVNEGSAGQEYTRQLIRQILNVGSRGGQIAGQDLYQTYQQNRQQQKPMAW